MTTENLKRVLSTGSEAASIVSDISRATNSPIAIWDMESNVLLRAATPESDGILKTHSILSDGRTVGWAVGGGQAALAAKLLTYLAEREAEKAELLDEILDLYRQVNLLFNLSEKLAASLQPKAVARTALDEACRLIEATGGAVVLLDEEQDPVLLASTGQATSPGTDPGCLDGILATVVSGARAEIINDVRLDARYAEGRDTIHSLLYAPLTSNNRSMGAVVVVSQVPVTYTAADLSLLNTLASQAAPALENALVYERTLREAQECEERLRQQVLDLRIELDEARQKQRVAEITGSEYYQRLCDRANTLRSIIGGPSAP